MSARVLADARSCMTGAALVLVLWFVAALSLIAVSVASTTRADTRAASLQVSQIRAAAVGDAAINLALRAAEADPALLDKLMVSRLDFDGQLVDVILRPDSGLISLNAASLELLRDLLGVAGELDPERAGIIAGRIEEWRSGDEGGRAVAAYEGAGVPFVPRHGRFEAPEDLLQVLGVDFDLYAKIRRLVSAVGDSAGVDVRFAPLEVLGVLAMGREDLAKSIYEALRAGEVGVDTTLLRQDHMQQPGPGSYLRAEAQVEIDGMRFSRFRWVLKMEGSTSTPWRTLSAETFVAPEPAARVLN